MKESVLGPEVFDRSSEYDPKIDSIVRVYAGRLRAKLDDYYQHDGASSPLRIRLPSGGYVPSFEPQNLPTTKAEVDATGTIAPAVGSHPAARRSRWMLPLAILGALIAGAVLFWSGGVHRPAARTNARDSIAVLPFVDLTGKSDFQYFEDGLSEELINRLTHVPGLRVISRTSSFMFRGHETDVQTIGTKLDVGTILEGSVRQRGSGLRISAQLIDARNGSELWSATFDRDLQDTVLIQEDISRAIIANLKAGPLMPAAEIASRHVPPIDAYDAYLRGRYLWFQVTPDGYRAAASQFEKAIELDPGYAPSYMALSQAYSGLATFAVVKPKDAWPQCKAMALKAIQLDPTLGEAHTTLGGARANYDWDQQSAESEYKQGIELAPGSSIAHQFYATFLGSLKRWKDADAQMSEARRLDPLWNLGIWGDAQLYYWEGKLDAAERRVQELINREPGFVPSYELKAQIYFQHGNARGALAILDRAPDAVRRTPRWIGSEGYFYALAGNAGEAHKCLERLKELAKNQVVSPYLAGLIYAALGDKDRAIQLIDEALNERLLRPGWIAVDPMFQSLRSDPRFQGLIRRVGL